MRSWHEQLPRVIGIGPQWATTNVRQKTEVVGQVRGSRSNKRLMYQPRMHRATGSSDVVDVVL